LQYDLVNDTYVGHQYFISHKPQDIVVSPVQVFENKNNSFDFASKIDNVNPNFWGEFEYDFTADGKDNNYEKGFILPGDSKYLVALSKTISLNSPVQLKITNLNWHRVNSKQITDWEKFKQSHLDIEISEIKYTSGSNNPISDKLGLNKLSFMIKNNTAYNYQSFSLPILFMNGGGLAGVNKYTINKLMSGEKYQVDLSWHAGFEFINTVVITPEINIFDNSSYIKPTEKTTEKN
jgi:hypothetical protein